MKFHGRIKGNVIIPDEPLPFPEGMKVEVKVSLRKPEHESKDDSPTPDGSPSAAKVREKS